MLTEHFYCYYLIIYICSIENEKKGDSFFFHSCKLKAISFKFPDRVKFKETIVNFFICKIIYPHNFCIKKFIKLIEDLK
jgi:hypothetical protein